MQTKQQGDLIPSKIRHVLCTLCRIDVLEVARLAQTKAKTPDVSLWSEANYVCLCPLSFEPRRHQSRMKPSVSKLVTWRSVTVRRSQAVMDGRRWRQLKKASEARSPKSSRTFSRGSELTRDNCIKPARVRPAVNCFWLVDATIPETEAFSLCIVLNMLRYSVFCKYFRKCRRSEFRNWWCNFVHTMQATKQGKPTPPPNLSGLRNLF